MDQDKSFSLKESGRILYFLPYTLSKAPNFNSKALQLGQWSIKTPEYSKSMNKMVDRFICPVILIVGLIVNPLCSAFFTDSKTPCKPPSLIFLAIKLRIVNVKKDPFCCQAPVKEIVV